MSARYKIGLLTYPGSPILEPALQQVRQRENWEVCVLSEGSEVHEKFASIAVERTGGLYQPKPLEALEAYQVPFFLMTNHNKAADLIQQLGLDVVLSCGTPRRLSTAFLEASRWGVVNAHPGQLPKYRGRSCLEWSIYNGDPVGATTHIMTEGYDEGPIHAFFALDIAGLSYEEIRFNMSHIQAKALAETADFLLANGTDTLRRQGKEEGIFWDHMPAETLQALKAKLKQ